MAEISDAARKARNEYKRQWREKNKDKVNEYMRNWKQDNKERVAEYQSRYWEKKSQANQ